jgi:hypothetical protein
MRNGVIRQSAGACLDDRPSYNTPNRPRPGAHHDATQHAGTFFAGNSQRSAGRSARRRYCSPRRHHRRVGGQCAEALAESRHVMTKCAVNWIGKDRKTYCFNSEAAKKLFLDNPDQNLQRAREFIAASSVASTEKAMRSSSNWSSMMSISRVPSTATVSSPTSSFTILRIRKSDTSSISGWSRPMGSCRYRRSAFTRLR